MDHERDISTSIVASCADFIAAQSHPFGMEVFHSWIRIDHTLQFPPTKIQKMHHPIITANTVSGPLGRWAVGSPSVCDWTLGIPTSGCLGCGWKVQSPGGWFMIRSGIIRTNKPGSTDGCWILLILFTSNTTDTGIIWNYQVGLLFSPS